MGANNSKPRTVQLPNGSLFKITPEVVKRIDEAHHGSSSKPYYCDNCSKIVNVSQNSQPLHSTSPNVLQKFSRQQRKSAEAEEVQFGKALERINKLFGNPVNWAKDYSTEIADLKSALIGCYREYHAEPLRCANFAQQFHTFIFRKHFEMISDDTKKSSTKEEKSGTTK